MSAERQTESVQNSTRDEVAGLVAAIWPERGCPTPGCNGDPRYAAPGRHHIEGCTYPVIPPGASA